MLRSKRRVRSVRARSARISLLSLFTFLLCLSNYMNISRIAHSYRKYITRKLTLECGLDCDENSNTNAQTQVHCTIRSLPEDWILSRTLWCVEFTHNADHTHSHIQIRRIHEIKIHARGNTVRYYVGSRGWRTSIHLLTSHQYGNAESDML